MVVLDRIASEGADGPSTSILRDVQANPLCPEFRSVPVNKFAGEPKAWEILRISTIDSIYQCHGRLLAILTCEDGGARLEEGPEVLVGHDTLALHILRRIDHALELLDEKLLQQLSVRLRGALVFGIIIQLGDGLFEL
jgi:hypothetical protein